MGSKVFATLILALLILILTAGSAMCATYDSNLVLENKDDMWNLVDDDVSATVEYNSAGDEFAWHAYGTVPNFEVGQDCEYALIGRRAASTKTRIETWSADVYPH